ncbi:hypothetical protein [Martelella sp. HB161492]|uniref:hypothetical protein n=1 Tax=Martelella sp. HB161492 TaxID=2720726 RepID=UPI001591206C|nr:hypothetical protein [Martelella sp. HB161492]
MSRQTDDRSRAKRWPKAGHTATLGTSLRAVGHIHKTDLSVLCLINIAAPILYGFIIEAPLSEIDFMLAAMRAEIRNAPGGISETADLIRLSAFIGVQCLNLCAACQFSKGRLAFLTLFALNFLALPVAMIGFVPALPEILQHAPFALGDSLAPGTHQSQGQFLLTLLTAILYR